MVHQATITTRQRINFWSSPRNISTALMYAFAQHPSVAVVDEPLYAHYLSRQTSTAEHPGKAEILASQSRDGAVVVRQLLDEDYGRPSVVFKQMTHHLIDLDPSFLAAMDNVLLIRDPRAILNSYSKVVRDVSHEDIGVRQQYALFQRLRTNGGLRAVVDSRRLLQDPAGVLSRLCERLDLPYTNDLLTWTAGGRPEDGVWAPYWYANVHKSTGFQAYRERTFTLPSSLEQIAEECAPLYASMLEAAL